MQEVIIRLKGTQIGSSGEKTNVEHQAHGQYYWKNNIAYISYYEADGQTKTLLKLEEGALHIVRRGAISHEQLFAKGRKSAGAYRLKGASFKMEVLTTKLKIEHRAALAAGNVFLRYKLFLNGQWQSDNELLIEFMSP